MNALSDNISFLNQVRLCDFLLHLVNEGTSILPEQSTTESKAARTLCIDAVAAQRHKRIAILMCTFNGEAHLEEQLESIRQQSFQHIDIWVSDDGSNDNTISILEDFKQRWPKGRFEVLSGPQQGFATNFLSLVCNSEIMADFYAYSDQDDIWELDKLSRAMHQIEQHSQTPALYCSRTSLIAECGKPLKRKSPRFHRLPSFQNALVQSLAGGNTMVFNQAARQIVMQAGMQKIISHDWWTYMLISGVGGNVFYDPAPLVRYRQHSDNQIGANIGPLARVKRLKMLLKGSFSNWNNVHILSLYKVRNLLITDNQKTLDEFANARQAKLIKRLISLRSSGVYRQTTLDSIVLWMATVLNKI